MSHFLFCVYNIRNRDQVKLQSTMEYCQFMCTSVSTISSFIEDLFQQKSNTGFKLLQIFEILSCGWTNIFGNFKLLLQKKIRKTISEICFYDEDIIISEQINVLEGGNLNLFYFKNPQFP